jgi:hypothetical protein
MPEIVEYDQYSAMLSITVATQRPEAQPSGIFAATKLHEEYLARVRAALREYLAPLDPYLTALRVDKIMPAGGIREIEGSYDITRLAFNLRVLVTKAAWISTDNAWLALEHNLEQATHDLFEGAATCVQPRRAR